MDPSGEEALAVAPQTATSAAAPDRVAEFEDFVASRSRRLLATAYLLTHDHGRAEDLLQTSLAKLWLAWSRVDEPDAYVRKVMVTTYASWWRRKWRGERPSDAVPETSASDPSRDPDMWSALARLPRGQRAVLVLRYLCDMSINDTAATLRCSTGNVKAQTARALQAMRARLTAQDSPPPTHSRSTR